MGGKNNRYFNLTQKLKIKSEMSLKNKITFVLILSVILTVAYALLGQNRDNSVKTVVRPVQGETKQVDIQVIEEGSEEPVDISFKVAPKTYSREEAKKLLEESAQNLEEFIKGDNEDLSHVKQNLKLDGYLSQYGIKAEWMSSDYELISYDGEVYNEDFENDEKRNVTLTSNLSIGEESISKVIDVTVLAKDYTAEEQKQKSILAAVEKAQLSEAEKDTFSLPDSADGKKIKFMLPGNKPVPIVFMGLGVMASVFIYISDKKKKERLQKERNDRLISDYAGLTSKISLLTGAGMTIYGAITSITSAYKKQKEKKGGQKKEAYEHLSETLDMIKMGEGEAESYVRFGELCTVREYKKLGVYLSENFKKGTGDIGRLLGEEARESFIKQKANVKVKAEEATTRLLFPMTLMLGVVMAVVLVPSMLSFTI